MNMIDIENMNDFESLTISDSTQFLNVLMSLFHKEKTVQSDRYHICDTTGIENVSIVLKLDNILTCSFKRWSYAIKLSRKQNESNHDRKCDLLKYLSINQEITS